MSLDAQTTSALCYLIYPIQFDADPCAALDRVFNPRILPGLTESPQEFLAAINTALESSERLADVIPQSHPEAVIRAYLAAVRKRLENGS
jgi:hypothetical protein